MNTRRSGLVWWGAMVVLCVAVAYGIVQVRHVLDELSGARNDRDALAQQVRDMGGVPTVGPKGEDGNDGERGADGRDGQPGGDGTPGVRGEPGADGAPGAAGSDGADGSDGLPGRMGADGASGADGAPGPQGPPGPVGEQGPQGDKGDPGEAGESVMCPAGYTPTDVMWLGETYSLCRKDATP